MIRAGVFPLPARQATGSPRPLASTTSDGMRQEVLCDSLSNQSRNRQTAILQLPREAPQGLQLLDVRRENRVPQFGSFRSFHSAITSPKGPGSSAHARHGREILTQRAPHTSAPRAMSWFRGFAWSAFAHKFGHVLLRRGPREGRWVFRPAFPLAVALFGSEHGQVTESAAA